MPVEGEANLHDGIESEAAEPHGQIGRLARLILTCQYRCEGIQLSLVVSSTGANESSARYETNVVLDDRLHLKNGPAREEGEQQVSSTFIFGVVQKTKR